VVERKNADQPWGLITSFRNLSVLAPVAACAADLPVDNNGVVTEPTAEQRHLLETIWATFCSEKAWPKYVGVEKKLSDGGLNLRQLTESMPLA